MIVLFICFDLCFLGKLSSNLLKAILISGSIQCKLNSLFWLPSSIPERRILHPEKQYCLQSAPNVGYREENNWVSVIE